jgi:GTP-binding protein
MVCHAPDTAQAGSPVFRNRSGIMEAPPRLHRMSPHTHRLRDDIRNIAIIAHVDHGKTTLVDKLLQQSGTFAAHAELVDRVMDAGLERERGITILAKNAACRYRGVKINIIDTPGHADFGGEVERGLTMVDGVLLLVDASEGPLPQTRFVLRKALAARLPVILVVNKVDRPDARTDDVVEEIYQLFFDLDADESQIDFPIVYTVGKEGLASLTQDDQGTDLGPLFELILDRVPPPRYHEGAPFQARVANLDASPYLGRMALCRVHEGELAKGEPVAWCRADGSVVRTKISELFVAEGLERVAADRVGPGDVIAVSGIEQIMIGETIADADDPHALPVIAVDEPSLAMTLGPNSSPLAGRSGTRMTARMIKERLDRELVGNVSLRVLETDRPDQWEVRGRGELQLGVLIELMRREGFELTVGKPQIVTREVDGRTCEPVERVTIDVPEEYSGTVIQALAARKGRMEHMTNHGTGWVRLDYLIPARGLLGFRTEFLTETRGTGILHSVFERYEPWHGEIRGRQNGSLIADRSGEASSYAMTNLQERGVLFVSPGDECYEGMLVGENARVDDLDVNISKAKQMTNVRSNADVLTKLAPPRHLSLDQALEYIEEDECVEVTPDVIRLRKVELTASTRQSARAKGKQQRVAQSSAR